MELFFSFIVPVYNRPNEIRELLDSLLYQTYTGPFEIVIVEDGSTISSKEVVSAYESQLSITYLEKANSGPGDSRNYGMRHAKGNYFLVLDSDCLLPPEYLDVVHTSLKAEFVDCYGGPDAAHQSFSKVQKAINYAMTSVLTTGGIRGAKKAVDKFQPRSFNMGISKKAFMATGGYGNIHPGEDPDLTIRIWEKGFKTKLIPEAFVYHKRRIDWKKFYVQVNKFGMVRPILNKWHPGTAKITYWFPSFFCLGLLVSFVFAIMGSTFLLLVYGFYFGMVFIDALVKNRDLEIAILTLVAVTIQFYGYGKGFLQVTLKMNATQKEPEDIFPNLFFKTD
ncbi:glycosyl transferase family 2 [Sediminicola sp. YIK13]|uniref:glycosyltransferase n=1 Tax=Sediminicola sp. YIK13 TaxID=1453352 RepID=UPI00071F2367|nr:glycosyltransferase [Sediminicola sp. YIK13]ALM07289.1 glycosyl transferase family 2 [Sediminicola sp. YIK13]